MEISRRSSSAETEENDDAASDYYAGKP